MQHLKQIIAKQDILIAAQKDLIKLLRAQAAQRRRAAQHRD